MSSRRNTSYNGGGKSFSKNGPRSSIREQHQKQPHRLSSEPDKGEFRAMQLLRRIFNDEDDTSFSRRLSNANQLLKLLEESRNTATDSLQFRQEQMQLLDICIYDEGLPRIIEFAKAPSSLKNALAKVISGLACYTRLDLALSWIFDRLEKWPTTKTSISEASKDREWKKWLLRLLKQVLIDSANDKFTYRQAQEMSPTILAGLITFLDAMDSPDYLPILLELLIYFSENYQNIFGQRFKDIIDLLVGWNMDNGLTESKREAISLSYGTFSIYWASYLPFAIELLNHFLDDISGILQELATTSYGDTDEYLGRWKICTILFGCYRSILDAILPSVPKSSNYHALQSSFEKMLPRVMSLTTDAFATDANSEWIQIAKDVILSLTVHKPSLYRAYQYDIFNYLFSPAKLDIPTSPYDYIDSVIKFIDLWDTDIDEEIVYTLLYVETSPLYKLLAKHRNDTTLNESILATLRFLHRVPISTNTRAHINHQYLSCIAKNKKIIEHFFSNKSGNETLKRTMSFIEQNEDYLVSAETYEASETKTNVNYVISDILLLDYLLLDLASVWELLRYENTLASLDLLCLAWSYRCNDIFDSCFVLLKDYWASLSFLLDNEVEFEIIADLLLDILGGWTQVDLSTRSALCEFMKSMLTLCDYEDFEVDPTVTFGPIMSGLLYAAGVEKNNSVKEAILNIINYYCQIFGSAEIIDSILQHVQKSLNDTNCKVKSASKDLLTALNPFMVSEVARFDDTTSAVIENIIMATPHTGSFRPVHYEIVMKQLGMTEYLIASDGRSSSSAVDSKNTSEWARRLLHHCDTVGNMRNVNMFGELKEEIEVNGIVNEINSSETLLYYWAMWESARYCMLSRLRTPFGGPQQTFAAFERILESLVGNTNILEGEGQSIDSLRHLLLLLDRLELQILNASDGCATNALPAVPRSSIVFFRTNKKTCYDYFLRIRPNIIAGAKIVNNDHLLIAQVLKMLSALDKSIPALADVKPWFKQLNSYLVDLVEACIRKQYTDLIYGMQSWYKKLVRKVLQTVPSFKDEWVFDGLVGPLPKETSEISSATVTWFQVAALFASGCDETAIKSLTTLKSFVDRDNYGILDMLDKQVVNFFACLEDYDALQQNIDSGSRVLNDFICDSLKSFNSGTGTDTERETALSNMQIFVKNAPLESCIEIARLDRFRDWFASTSNDSQELNANITSELTERILQVLKDGIFTNISSLLELQLLQSDWDSLIASAKDWFNITSGNIPNFHNLPPETKHWTRLCTYFERLYTSYTRGKRTDVAQYLGYIQLHSAKVARRQTNFTSAEKLIDKAVLTSNTKYLALYERTKVLFSQSQYTEAMKTINEVLLHTASVPQYQELKGKAYLKIARYLKNSPASEVMSLLEKLDSNLMEMSATNLQSSVENSIDFALAKSIEYNKEDGRPWFEYATHYYKQGWRILDEVLRPESSMTIVLWAKEKISSVLEDVDCGVDRTQIEKTIFNLLIKHSSSVGGGSLVDCSSLTAALRQAVPFLNSEGESLILETLDTLQKMVIGKFHASAKAYLRYLSLDTQKIVEKITHISSTSMVITATLRILRILTKYGGALKKLYLEHIETVRVDVWKQVIPQLFAQLNHPDEFVRKIIGILINRICDEYPREIVYDVIVNSTSSKTNRDTKQSLDTIASRMMDRNELLWVSTRRMAEELEKITVLLEEKWQNKIASLQFDVMQQFSKIDQELERFDKSGDDEQRDKTFWEVYGNVMKFVILSIEPLYVETTQDSVVSTPHELWFKNTYEKHITQAYDLLKKPASMKEYRRGWESFQKLYRQMMAETNKLRILELSQISPYLSEMKSTLIGIPGLHENDDSCFIDSFHNSVIVLPTKTKPKKLDMKGTDGKKYSYLFKGLEDLHLDERVMQLLSTTNGLLSETGATALRDIKARTYAVIPLSDHSGMIQWVNDATPFFALYKKWQKRESAAHVLLSNDKPNEAYMQSLMQKPTEMFTTKVASVLKSAGLRVTANRKHWPKEILKKVYLELVKDTPGDLLEKELYYSSATAEEWYKKSTSFARSLAVTSMIGYIIGLGDRHLDNMLVDFRSGEIIHIDYNVCFEKGRRLRVPELVPYRLTQNLYGALGITGVEGQFKIAAEETLRVLRTHKEVLITLLDAFVYDPLVDWESEAVEAGYRQMMELQTNVGLVATRIIEKQLENEKERSAILGNISSLQHNLQQWQESMLLEAESLNEEDGSEDEANFDSTLSSPTDQNASSYVGRLPIYLLREVKSHLSGIISLLAQSSSSNEGMSPLLESIIIIETDADNELRPAQKSAKVALESLANLDTECKKLDEQIKFNKNYESEWTYPQLMNIITVILKSVQDYYSAIRTLEEFGPDNNKNGITTTGDDNKRGRDETKPLELFEGGDDDNENSQVEHAVAQPNLNNGNANGSQKTSLFKTTTNPHVVKIMKRIRSKLEGVDFNVKHKMSVSEQVARSIDQATSIDNLCLMYEGWTSWV